jgi:hypothetical protein
MQLFFTELLYSKLLILYSIINHLLLICSYIFNYLEIYAVICNYLLMNRIFHIYKSLVINI